MQYEQDGRAGDSALFLKALKSGTLPLAPGKDGLADTAPVSNALTGKPFKGMDAVLLKAHMKEHGMKEPSFICVNETRAALNEKGMSFSESSFVKNGNSMAYISSNTFINTGDLNKNGFPLKLSSGQERPGMQGVSSLKCVSTDPSSTLGIYMAALETGRPFKITATQYEAWSKKTEHFIGVKKGKEKEGPVAGHAAKKPDKSFLKDAGKKLNTLSNSVDDFSKLVGAAVKAAAMLVMAISNPSLAAAGLAAGISR